MTFHACHPAANFTADWALSIALIRMNITMQCSKGDIFAHMAFKNSMWETDFFTYFTVDVVTWWTWCWSLFALTNWLFVNGILNTALPKWLYASLNQFAPLTSIQCHFFPLVHQYAELFEANFYWVLKSFLLFWCLSLSFTRFTPKQLFLQATVIQVLGIEFFIH